MALRRQIQDAVHPFHDLPNKRGVADVALHERVAGFASASLRLARFPA